MLEQLQSYFARNSKTMVKQINDALEADNIILAHRLAHTLKGNAEMIREKQLYNAAAAVEGALKNEKNRVSNEQLYVLETEFNIVLDKLSKRTNNVEKSSSELIVDKAVIRALINKLEPLLMNFDTDCYNMVDEMRQIPGMEALSRYVEVFNYKDALLEISKLKEKVGLEA